MFDKGYRFNLVDKRETPKESVLITWKYNFKTDKRRYVVLVEKYQYNVYIIKYYAACHTKSKYKYTYLFNDEKPARIIRTCIDILLKYYKEDKDASFGFIGAYSTNKKKNGNKIIEPPSNTQRYRIYRMLMFNYFGRESFTHATNKKHSAYLIINKKVGKIREFKKKTEAMFTKLYLEINIRT